MFEAKRLLGFICIVNALLISTLDASYSNWFWHSPFGDVYAHTYESYLYTSLETAITQIGSLHFKYEPQDVQDQICKTVFDLKHLCIKTLIENQKSYNENINYQTTWPALDHAITAIAQKEVDQRLKGINILAQNRALLVETYAHGQVLTNYALSSITFEK